MAAEFYALTFKSFENQNIAVGDWKYYVANGTYSQPSEIRSAANDFSKWKDLVFANYPAENKTYIVPRAFASVRERFVLESTLLASNFTMLIPKETQQTVFSNNPYSVIVGFDSGKVSISDAVKNKLDLWTLYFKNLTSLVEASKAADVLEFEASLSLDLFCKYGQPLRDLTAK